jgi:hypothetical protein
MANVRNDPFDLEANHSEWPVRLVAGIVFLNGLFAILVVLYSRLSQRLESLLPFNFRADCCCASGWHGGLHLWRLCW